jgi:dolichyl-phosphate-mannose-protein mannosyltransferase
MSEIAGTGPVQDDPSVNKKSFFSGGMWIVSLMAVVTFAFHWFFNNRYGYFRDEFNYMASGDHLAWGYVDQPPLIPFLIKICRMVLGDSLRSVRFIPALAAAALVVLTAMIARELGGKRFALILAAVTAIVAPIYLSAGSLLTTNCLEPILWMGCVYFAILAIRRSDARYWLWFGVVTGIGLEEKYSIAILGFGIVLGLLLTKERRAFSSKWIWLGAIAAFLIFLPNILWNVHNHWPFFELMHNIRADGRDVQLPVLEFFAQQVLLLHPITAPIWITGLIALLFSKRLAPYRLLGWCYLAAFTAFVLLHGKNYYLAPIYPMLLAAGAVMIESGIKRTRQLWLQPVIVLVLLAGGAWFAPLIVPVLPVDKFLVYMDKLPFKVPRSEHSHMAAVLPQHYADQFGWEEITAKVAEVWNSLPPAERAGCGIFAQDYGQAGAIDFLGRRYGLPLALSGHQTYFLWGPRGYSGNCLIVLDDKQEVLEELFEHVEFVGVSKDNPYALEREIPVFICKGSKFGSLTDFWPKVKKWR